MIIRLSMITHLVDVNDALDGIIDSEKTVVFQGEVVPRAWFELYPDTDPSDIRG